MEVAIGVDALKWYGQSLQPLVIPLRKLFDKFCKENYCGTFKYVDFGIRVGESKGGVATRAGRVEAKPISRRS